MSGMLCGEKDPRSGATGPEALVRAVSVLVSPASTNSDVQTANAVLSALEQSPFAWKVCIDMIVSGGARVTSPAEAHARAFCAQALHRKTMRRDHRTMPPASREALCLRLVQAAHRLEALAVQGSSSDRRALAHVSLSLAVLAVDAGLAAVKEAKSLSAVALPIAALTKRLGAGPSSTTGKPSSTLAQAELLCAVAEKGFHLDSEVLLKAPRGAKVKKSKRRKKKKSPSDGMSSNEAATPRHALVAALFPSVWSLIHRILAGAQQGSSRAASLATNRAFACGSTWLRLRTAAPAHSPPAPDAKAVSVAFGVLAAHGDDGVWASAQDAAFTFLFTYSQSFSDLKTRGTQQAQAATVASARGFMRALGSAVATASRARRPHPPRGIARLAVCVMREMMAFLSSTVEADQIACRPALTALFDFLHDASLCPDVCDVWERLHKATVSQGVNPVVTIYLNRAIQALCGRVVLPRGHARLSADTRETFSTLRRRVRDALRHIATGPRLRLIVRAAAVALDALAAALPKAPLSKSPDAGIPQGFADAVRTAEGALHCATAVLSRMCKWALGGGSDAGDQRIISAFFQKLCIVCDALLRSTAPPTSVRAVWCAAVAALGQMAAWVSTDADRWRRALQMTMASLRLPETAALYPMRVSQDHIGATALVKLAQARAAAAQNDAKVGVPGPCLSPPQFESLCRHIHARAVPGCSTPDTERGRDKGGGVRDGITGASYLLLLRALGSVTASMGGGGSSARDELPAAAVNQMAMPPIGVLERAVQAMRASPRSQQARSAAADALHALSSALEPLAEYPKLYVATGSQNGGWTAPAALVVAKNWRLISTAMSLFRDDSVAMPPLVKVLSAALAPSARGGAAAQQIRQRAAQFATRSFCARPQSCHLCLLREAVAGAREEWGRNAIALVTDALQTRVWRSSTGGQAGAVVDRSGGPGFDAEPDMSLEWLLLVTDLLQGPAAGAPPSDRMFRAVVSLGLRTQEPALGRRVCAALDALVHVPRLRGLLVERKGGVFLLRALLRAADGGMPRSTFRDLMRLFWRTAAAFVGGGIWGGWLAAALRADWAHAKSARQLKEFYDVALDAVGRGDSTRLKSVVKNLCGGKKKTAKARGASVEMKF